MQYRLFDPASPPACADPGWYLDRERAPHLEEEVHKARLYSARDLVVTAMQRWGVQTVSDLGCGDGGLLQLLADLPGLRSWGYDLQISNVTAAVHDRGVAAQLGDVVRDEDLEVGALSVCTEILEHLVDPHEFLRRLRSPFLVASSPVNEDGEHHYEHHLWAFDQSGYVELLAAGGYHLAAEVITPPFQVMLGYR